MSSKSKDRSSSHRLGTALESKTGQVQLTGFVNPGDQTSSNTRQIWAPGEAGLLSKKKSKSQSGATPATDDES